MNKQNVIAIFDVGKTNKKLLLFDEQYQLVYEESESFRETVDEDGFACEDVDTLSKWVCGKFHDISGNMEYKICGINFSAYGASFVHLEDNFNPLTPLYNYLKPYPENLKKQFYDTYGGESVLSKETASPVLGSLNSGLQLYRLKYERPDVYKQVKYSLHLPQYLSFLISSQTTSDITSVGCHTHLWDFRKHDYHRWVYNEGLEAKFPSIYGGDKIISLENANGKIPVGVGLHDSSAALIPYLSSFAEPFVLISTGTWCISLNPFNHSLLSDYELQQDCLSYLTYQGKPVKASRLFAGYEHEQQVKRLAGHFNKENGYYKTVRYDEALLKKLQRLQQPRQFNYGTAMVKESAFTQRVLHDFETYEEAYHQLILDIMIQQVRSTKIILNGSPVKRIFVDGGFTQNSVYMNLLASAFTGIEVYAATIPQASALGAALAIHTHWNKTPLPTDLINLKHFKPAAYITL